jgi:hypothetical protein
LKYKQIESRWGYAFSFSKKGRKLLDSTFGSWKKGGKGFSEKGCTTVRIIQQVVFQQHLTATWFTLFILTKFPLFHVAWIERNLILLITYWKKSLNSMNWTCSSLQEYGQGCSLYLPTQLFSKKWSSDGFRITRAVSPLKVWTSLHVAYTMCELKTTEWMFHNNYN